MGRLREIGGFIEVSLSVERLVSLQDLSSSDSGIKMSRNVKLFPSYSQKENQTTNHCLLILKLLYEQSPKFLAEALNNLFSEQFTGSIGVDFTQQIRSGNAIPDGEISQQPFSILIETKLREDFHPEQLRRHLETFKTRAGVKLLVALGNFESDDTSAKPAFQSIYEEAKACGASFCAVSFEQFLEAIQAVELLPKHLVDAIADLQEYFDEENLLPSWKYRLDVVNCKQSFDSVVKNQLYTCPAKGGHYSHRRSLYFGTYRNKQVEKIAQIQAVVDLESDSEAVLKWNNSSLSKEEVVDRTRVKRSSHEDSWYPARAFLLGEVYHTDFRKDTSGGMYGSKQYFDIQHLKAETAKELAEKLAGETWSKF